MMRDPRYTEAWVDELVFRIQQLHQTQPQAESVSPAISEHDPDTDSAAEATMPPNCKITRSSAANLAALRNLQPAANILLFTPVIRPAGRVLDTAETDTIDPFEEVGRALSKYHRRIRHVPYVAKVGFTETHDAFISQADAVITVVCEPEEGKYQSMEWQMDFAEQALDALEGKEANAAHALVLLQCGEDEYRPPVDASFMNVVESTTYSTEIAKAVAHAIFKARI